MIIIIVESFLKGCVVIRIQSSYVYTYIGKQQEYKWKEYGQDTAWMRTRTYMCTYTHHTKLVRIPRVEQPVHGPVTLKSHLCKMYSNTSERWTRYATEDESQWPSGFAEGELSFRVLLSSFFFTTTLFSFYSFPFFSFCFVSFRFTTFT